MRITKKHLRRIIREEVERIQEEAWMQAAYADEPVPETERDSYPDLTRWSHPDPRHPYRGRWVHVEVPPDKQGSWVSARDWVKQAFDLTDDEVDTWPATREMPTAYSRLLSRPRQ